MMYTVLSRGRAARVAPRESYNRCPWWPADEEAARGPCSTRAQQDALHRRDHAGVEAGAGSVFRECEATGDRKPRWGPRWPDISEASRTGRRRGGAREGRGHAAKPGTRAVPGHPGEPAFSRGWASSDSGWDEEAVGARPDPLAGRREHRRPDRPRRGCARRLAPSGPRALPTVRYPRARR
jgi:hypothetical protein